MDHQGGKHTSSRPVQSSTAHGWKNSPLYITCATPFLQFCVLIVLAMGVYVGSGGWALWQKSTLSQDMTGQLQRAIQDYDSISAYAEVWDVVQNRVRTVPSQNLVCHSISPIVQLLWCGDCTRLGEFSEPLDLTPPSFVLC